MFKRFLVLGAGNAQIDAIEYCKEKGYEVVGCSYTTVDNGIPYLDYFEQVDIKDAASVAELAGRYDVSAVYSIGSDLAIPTAAKVSEDLGLPRFISPETAAICHSKGKMRKALGSSFDGNAKFLLCHTLEEALRYADFPGMMKPVDSQGQRGCFKVESGEDIRKHFNDALGFSIEKDVIIEEYVEGPEISVNVYFQDGDMRFSAISDRYTFEEYPGGIIKEHRIPSSFADEDAQRLTIDLVKRVAVRLGITDGPAYYQIKLKDGKNPILLEVAPRLDGCHMWNLIKHYCGADLLDATFRHLLNREQVLVGAYEMPREEYCLRFMSREPNTIFDREEFDVRGTEYYRYYYDTGDRVMKVNGYIEKCGYKILKTGRRID